MIYILYFLFFAACITLIGAVLLQPGKTDAGALFTSNVSSSAFAPRGSASVLSRITIGAAAVFMVSALLISMPALSGNVSVLQSTSAETPGDAPSEVPAVTNSNADANASANTPDTNTNSALIETPATEAFEANTNAAPANK
ncbi:MAG: preprotein translocase subunit SecG [Saprospiraceae bacterium]|nr:preprotein translocase subunit SecG [Pyrinomonadaceae bacterium]